MTNADDLRAECRKLVDEWPDWSLPALLNVLQSIQTPSMREIPPLKFDDTFPIGSDFIPVRFTAPNGWSLEQRWLVAPAYLHNCHCPDCEAARKMLAEDKGSE